MQVQFTTLVGFKTNQMKGKIFLLIVAFAVSITASAQRRYDSTMKVGKVGYRVSTNNKNEEKNSTTISPIGFSSGARDVTIEVRGRITRSEVDDLNRDGFPDLVMYIFNGVKNTGTVLGVSSDKNESFQPIIFPDIVDDPKLRVGYNGGDQFLLMEGMLIRRFPLHTMDSASNTMKPIGMTRQIMYTVAPDEKGTQRFKAGRSYDFAKP
jgi:hypothetical protein